VATRRNKVAVMKSRIMDPPLFRTVLISKTTRPAFCKNFFLADKRPA
jgi:hypothetical protein